MFDLLMIAAAVGLTPAPASPAQCTLHGITVAHRKRDLPPEVLHVLEPNLADSTERMRATDVMAPGDEGLKSRRLICGYPTLDGYIVERERGGLGFGIDRIAFDRTPTGYALDPASLRQL